MFKKILLFITIIICVSSFLQLDNTYATQDYDSMVKSSSATNNAKNDHLEEIKTNTFLQPSSTNKGANGIKDFIIKIAKDVKNVFYAVATIYFLIITIRLLFASNSEESFESYKKGLIWITLGIIVMQMSYAFVVSVYDSGVSGFAGNLINTVFIPIIKLLETLASMFFLLIAIYSFIRLVSTNGDKEKAKKGIDSIIYATVGIFLVILSTKIVTSIYGNYNISVSGLTTIQKESGFSSMTNMFMNFINWMTGFVAIVTLIMIMYAGANIIFAAGDEEKVKKGRTTIIYAIIGIFIMVISYLILTFFIGPEGVRINKI